jgi:IS605 OrfB family transposase
MRSYQTRIATSPELEGALDAYGELFGRCVRTLHALRRAGRAPTKPAFMARFELTARQYNAVKNTLDGIELSYRRRLPELIAEDRQRLASIRRRLKPGKQAEPALTPFVRHNLQRREARIKDRIARREREREDGSVRIAFGSRRLFRAQHALDVNSYASHVEWLSAWRSARSGSFFVLGSKDETAGCQGCVLTHLEDNRFSLRLRLPKNAAEKYASFDISFAYGWEHLAWALEAGQAISYRFVRDAKGWRVFASTAAPPIARQSDLARGVLGVDLNADHVALAQSSADGNVLWYERVPLVTYGKSADAAGALTGDAVKAIVAAAVRRRIPLSVEKLDFRTKRSRLREGGARYARMLSSFAYRRFVQVLCARAHDAGIAVHFVNPAYSSLIGRRKFARRYGISGHQAAALVLARRAQDFSERPNRQDQVARRSPARKNARHVWSTWARVAREKTRVALSERSEPKTVAKRSSSAFDPSRAAAHGATHPFGAGGIPARQSVASTVRATS